MRTFPRDQMDHLLRFFISDIIDEIMPCYFQKHKKLLLSVKDNKEYQDSIISMLIHELNSDWQCAVSWADIKGNLFHYIITLSYPCKPNEAPLYIRKKEAHFARDELFYADLFDIFIRFGVDINGIDSFFGQSPLCAAIGFDQTNIAKALLNPGNAKINLNQTSNEAWGKTTALILAIQRGNKEIIELLIKKGADVNQADKNGLTPLHWSCVMLQQDMMQLLLQNGANKEARTKQNKRAQDYLATGLNDHDFLKQIKSQISAPLHGIFIQANDTLAPELRPLIAHFWGDRKAFIKYLTKKIDKENARTKCVLALEKGILSLPSLLNSNSHLH